MLKSARGAVDPFIVMDMVAAASRAEAAGRDIVHMEVGQPGTGAPRKALEAVRAGLGEDPLGYTVALGLPALREGIAALYAARYGVDLDPARVVVTSGSSGAFVLAFTALFDARARVGIAAPGYPSYRQILSALDIEPVVIPAQMATGFQPEGRDVAGYGLDGLLVASPANPTGTMLDRRALSGLMGAAEAAGAAFISDEIYHGIDYGHRAVSALEISDRAYVINSFSKYFSMTGWRIGWMVVPDDHVRFVERLAQNMFICAPHVAQIAALGALEAGEELEANCAVYRANRALMLEGLGAAGLTRFAPPDGAFYVYVDVSEHTEDALALSHRILDEAGVAVTPGLDFDAARGGRFIRMSYARGTDEIARGLERLGRFFARGA